MRRKLNSFLPAFLFRQQIQLLTPSISFLMSNFAHWMYGIYLSIYSVLQIYGIYLSTLFFRFMAYIYLLCSLDLWHLSIYSVLQIFGIYLSTPFFRFMASIYLSTLFLRKPYILRFCKAFNLRCKTPFSEKIMVHLNQILVQQMATQNLYTLSTVVF